MIIGAAASGVCCALLGLLALVGWYWHIPELVQMQPGFPPMQYNAALCLVLAGLALEVWALGRNRWVLPAAGGFIALMGALTLGEYVFHTNLGVDQLFFHCYIVSGTSAPGRMAPASAFCFTLAGPALAALWHPVGRRWRALAVGSAASIIISISLVALAGYAVGMPGTYGWGKLTRMAVHTSVCLGLVGLGLFLIAWKLGLRPGERTPRWLPVPLGLGVLTASVVLTFAFDAQQNEQVIQTVKAGADSATALVASRIEARIRSLVRMERRWEFSGRPAQAVWEDDAQSYVHDFPDLQAIEWIDNSRLIRWVAPLAGNEEELNRDLTLEPNRAAAIEQAERERQPVITPMLTLFRGGSGSVVYVPIFVKGQPDGLIAAALNAQYCLERYLPEVVAPGEAISISEHGRVVYTRDAGTPAKDPEWLVDEQIPLKGATWELRMWPTAEMTRRLNSPLSAVTLCVGTLGALLLGTVCYLAQRSSRHATEAVLANSALKNAIDQVKTLEGMLPMCACCKRVRDDSGYWSKIETYIHAHTNASLSHGYCPECAAKTFRDFGLTVPPEVQAAVEARNFE